MDRDLKYQYQWQHRCINNWSWKKWHDSVEQSWTMQYHVCHCFWCTKEHYFHQGIDLKFYYHKAGIDKAQKQSNKWNAQLLDLMEGRSIHHFKTSDYKEYISSIAFYGENYKNLWNSHAVTKKWSLQNFLLYCSKNSVIDKFLGSLNLDVDSDGYVHRYDRHVMLYGDGSFASGGRGEQSVPLKYIKKRCTLFFECHNVNEYRTSQICPDCKKCRLLAWEGCSWQGTNYRQRIEMVSFQWLSQELSQKSWLCQSKEYHVPWTWKWYWQSPIRSECAQMAKIHSRQSPFHTHSLIIPWDMIFVSMHAKENRM